MKSQTFLVPRDINFCNSHSALSLLIFGLMIGGCATVDVPRIGQVDYKVEDDERRMQKRADEACEKLDESSHLYRDLKLENYLTEFANNLLPENIKPWLKVSVKVLNEPSLNAFALPNGRIYIHAGMLAAIDNEAQLASLLGHEMTHIINRHQLKHFRSIINKSAFLSSVGGIMGAAGGDLAVVFTELAVVSSVYGYSRDLEVEADTSGFSMMMAAGYDINEAPKLFEHLKEFIDDEEIKLPFFFSDHPSVVARVESFKGLIAQNKGQSGARKVNQEPYEAMTSQLILNDVELCRERGMFQAGKRLLDKFVSKNPSDARAYFYLGELYREWQYDQKKKKRNKDEDYKQALTLYNKAISLDGQYAEAFKGRARVYQRQGNALEAKADFKKYLELKPNAGDKSYIEKFLSTN